MIRMKKHLIATLSLSLIIGMVLAAGPKEAAARNVKIDKVTVSAPSGKAAYVAKGKSVKLTVDVKTKSKKKADKKVTYKSADSKVASVNAKGVVKGIKAGKTKVTVTSSKDTKKKATISIVVKNTAVKSVKLKEKSAVISVGESKPLKAAVTPKKASNKIEWTSSKSSVAAVSDKGVVTGKKEGTATITAKAADGSGKKATVKVTVTDAVNMAAMDVQNVQTVTFSLDKPQPLAADSIFIKTKRYAGGEYRKQLNIESVSTSDNSNYSVVLKRDSRVLLHEYVQVSVPSLTGKVKSMEKEYVEQTCAFTNEEISVWVMNKYNRESFTFGNACGYASYTITGLPAGLSAEVEGDFMYVKGTPTAAGSTTATLSAVDEKGNTLTKSIYFIVGSGDVIAGAALPEYSLVSNFNDYINVSTYAQFTGGGNSYRYDIVNDGGIGAEIDNENSNSNGNVVYIRAAVPTPGEYNVTVRAVDDWGRSCDVVIPIHISQSIEVTGTIKDALGNPIPHASIQFANKNGADRFFSSGVFETDETGSYCVFVSPGIYDIVASSSSSREGYSLESDSAEATSCLCKKELSVNTSGLDFSLPLYKVTIVSSEYFPNNTRWYIEREFAGVGNTLYLRNGSYTIESTESLSTEGIYMFVGNVVVNGAVAQATVSKTITNSDAKLYY